MYNNETKEYRSEQRYTLLSAFLMRNHQADYEVKRPHEHYHKAFYCS